MNQSKTPARIAMRFFFFLEEEFHPSNSWWVEQLEISDRQVIRLRKKVSLMPSERTSDAILEVKKKYEANELQI